MATSIANPHGLPVAVEGANGNLRHEDDPFGSNSTMQPPRPQRYSSFDTQLFGQDQLTSSPGHTKRALEVYLAETERRLSEASRLGTTLVAQRQQLSARLREVESKQGEAELSPELRQRLIEIEKEYNEVGRESVRAFLGPKADGVGSGAESDTPFGVFQLELLCATNQS